MTKQLSKRAQKAAEKQEMAVRVQVAFAEAMLAARSAYETHAATVQRSADGEEVGPLGDYTVYVFAPSYRFRAALIEAAIINRSYDGLWAIPHSVWGVKERVRAWGCGCICDAVHVVLKRHFPDECFGICL